MLSKQNNRRQFIARLRICAHRLGTSIVPRVQWKFINGPFSYSRFARSITAMFLCCCCCCFFFISTFSVPVIYSICGALRDCLFCAPFHSSTPHLSITSTLNQFLFVFFSVVLFSLCSSAYCAFVLWLVMLLFCLLSRCIVSVCLCATRYVLVVDNPLTFRSCVYPIWNGDQWKVIQLFIHSNAGEKINRKKMLCMKHVWKLKKYYSFWLCDGDKRHWWQSYSVS